MTIRGLVGPFRLLRKKEIARGPITAGRTAIVADLRCYRPEECTGVDNKGCAYRDPVFTSENWVHMTKGRGFDPPATVSSGEKVHTRGHANNTVRGG